jgi:hypothetical protein
MTPVHVLEYDDDRLLGRCRWALGAGYRDSYAYVPIGKPRGGLPIEISAA